MSDAEDTAKVAVVPPTVTWVADPRLAPLTVTLVPTGPFDGLKLLITGATKVLEAAKFEALEATPPAVVTVILPAPAPDGTLATIVVDEITVNTTALTLLNATGVAPVKPVPVIVTAVPTPPDVGEKLLIVGVTRNEVPETAGAPVVATLIGPVVAVLGTVAVT